MSQPGAYFNENDPQAAEWLRNLIAAGHIAPGDVDERSIEDVQPEDLRGYTQCHFFAGIGVWSYALRRAGWPDHRPVWTGSCPCPPFSAAGKGQRCPECGSPNNLCHPRKTGHFICLDCGCDRFADGRHLWPEFSRLIRDARPPVVFGEQVASKDGRYWLAAIQADLEGVGYASGAADLCGAGYGAPQIRQRLFFGAYDTRSAAGGLVHGLQPGLEGHAGNGGDRGEPGRQHEDTGGSVAPASGAGGLGDPEHLRCDSRVTRDAGGAEGARRECGDEPDRPGADTGGYPGPTNGFWGPADWLLCRDGKWRPVRPSTQQMVDGSNWPPAWDDCAPRKSNEPPKPSVSGRSDIKPTESKGCETCGTSFHRRRFASGRLEDLTAFKRRRFCSLSCANSQTKGGASRSAMNVQARKMLGPHCEFCGTTRSLVIHHADEDWTNNSRENLQTLCDSCHKSWHITRRLAGVYPAGKMPCRFPSPKMPPPEWCDCAPTATRSSRKSRPSSSRRSTTPSIEELLGEPDPEVEALLA